MSGRLLLRVFLFMSFSLCLFFYHTQLLFLHISTLDLSKASVPDCIPVVVLKKCEPELSYILAELFNKGQKESCFPDCWKVSSVVPVFKNAGQQTMTKNYHPVLLVFFVVITKVFEKLVNDKLVDHLDKCCFLPDCQYGFRPSDQMQNFWQLYLIELLGLLISLELLKLWHLIYLRLSTRFDMLFFTNVSLMEFLVRYLAFSVIGSFEWLQMEKQNTS